MASHPLDYLNDSMAWEVILVTTCHYAFLVFVVVFCFFSPSSSIIVLGKSRFFLLVLRKIDYALN